MRSNNDLVNITASTRTTLGWHSGNLSFGDSRQGADGKGPNPTTLAALGDRFLERFWPCVQQSPDDCWLWTAGKDAYGYGQIARRGGLSPIKAHRAMWMIVHGAITSKQHVLHHCDTPACVNPDHLFLGDQALNMKDAAAKGRLGGPRPSARVLSVSQEAELHDIYRRFAGRKRLPNGLRDRLAARYGVTGHYISVLGRKRRVRSTAEKVA